MGRKKLVQNPVRVTMLFHREDYEYMAELYPGHGAQPAIRALVRSHVQRMRLRRQGQIEVLSKEIDLEIEDE